MSCGIPWDVFELPSELNPLSYRYALKEFSDSSSSSCAYLLIFLKDSLCWPGVGVVVVEKHKHRTIVMTMHFFTDMYAILWWLCTYFVPIYYRTLCFFADSLLHIKIAIGFGQPYLLFSWCSKVIRQKPYLQLNLASFRIYHRASFSPLEWKSEILDHVIYLRNWDKLSVYFSIFERQD